MRTSWFGALVLFLAPLSPAGEGAFLGVSAAPLDAETRAHYAIPEEVAEGVVLSEIIEGSAAAAAGLRAGDVLVFFDGKPLKTYEELAARVAAHAAGDEVSYQLRRGTGTIEGTLKLGTRPAEPPADELEGRMRRLQDEIEVVRRTLHDKEARVVQLGRLHPPGVDRWIHREEKGLAEAKEKGDAEKVKFHEARLALLREMRDAAPAEVRLGLAGGLAAAGPRHAALEDRVAKLEKKVDEILARLNQPAAGGG